MRAWRAWLLLFVALLLHTPQAAAREAPLPLQPQLTKDARGRLAEASRNAALPTWQRDFMLEVAQGTPGPHRVATSPSNASFLPRSAAASADDGIWIGIPPPSRRTGHTAIYDPVRDRMLVFGGLNGYIGGTLRNDVWALSLGDNPVWTLIVPAGSPPPPREWHSATYDPVRDRMLVFGGSVDAGPPANDVWALSLAGTPAWAELTPQGTPPYGRWNSSAVYDPVGDRMLLIGGTVFTGGTYGSRSNDVWALSLSGSPAWSLLAAASPGGPVTTDNAIFDPVRNRVLVYGLGFDGVSYFSDLWAWSPTAPSWSQLNLPGPGAGNEGHHTAVYDPVRDRMVLYVDGEVWALSLAGSPAWNQITPAGAPAPVRAQHTAIYDPVRDRMLVFGGYGQFVFNDVWALGFATGPAWSELGTSPPLGRGNHSAIYDPLRNRMLVFAGYDILAFPYLNDLWALSLTSNPTWSELTPTGTPPSLPRVGHSAIYDPVRDRMLVFGGSVVDSGVWALSLAGGPAWSTLTTMGTSPSPRVGQTAIYDPQRDRMVVFGGFNSNSVVLNEVWTLSLAGTPYWTQLTPPGLPPAARAYHTAIYDPVRDRMVVFGGVRYDFTTRFDDVWVLPLEGSQPWSALSPVGAGPGARAYHTAIYDPVRDRMVVYGGSQVFEGGIVPWALGFSSGPGWTQLAPAMGPPAERSSHTAVYDPGGDRMVVFGGLPWNNGYDNDVWALTWGSPVPVPALPAMVSVEATPEVVTLLWQGTPQIVAGVERSESGSPWTNIGQAAADGSGQLRFQDRNVSAGSDYSYRLTLQVGGQQVYAGLVSVHVPAPSATLALAGARPNPAPGGFTVSFTLPDASPARLELYDVSGRRVLTRDVGSLGPGAHVLRLEETNRLSSGLYWLRLVHARDTLVARAAIVK